MLSVAQSAGVRIQMVRISQLKVSKTLLSSVMHCLKTYLRFILYIGLKNSERDTMLECLL